MVNYAGGNYTSGALKSIDLWAPPNSDATNSSGFTALPSGIRLASGSFQGLNGETFFGSDTSENDLFFAKSMFANQDQVYGATPELNTGVACRCIKDQ